MNGATYHTSHHHIAHIQQTENEDFINLFIGQ